MQPFSRRVRLLAALFALMAALFAQGAIAAHACLRGGPAVAVAMDAAEHAQDAAPGCSHKPADDSNVCRAHCETSVKPSEAAQPSLLLPPQIELVAAVSLAPPHAFLRSALAAPLLARGASPALPILHCCLRN